ncbi:hypothetical protein NNO_1257 [Hydrogenimonas sp.]|nr:hypothetical protein NNO_1257 [Hydrogenimonas sp.]
MPFILVFILIFMLFAPYLCANDGKIESMIGEYAQKADLSEKTKRESDGYLMVFTRQDLDRMQIRSLQEIIEKIPFIRYNEDRLGLSSSFYAPYQPNPPAGLRVYINNRVLYTPYFGNALKMFGQLDMGYIDHVEVYYGMPSQTLGIDGAVVVIKMYTKDPLREKTSLAGAVGGSEGYGELYGYTAGGKEDFSHLVYADYRNMKRKKESYNGSILSKDRESTNLFADFRMGNNSFEVQAVRGRLDTFLGFSPHLDPLNPHLSFSYLYGGWDYENRDNRLKAFLHLTRNSTRHYDASKSLLGVYPSPDGPVTFTTSRFNMLQYHAEAQLQKGFDAFGTESSVGMQARTGRFSFKEVYLDEKPYNAPSGYDRETALSLFAQSSYMIDESKIAVASVKGDRYLERSGVKDYTLFSGRLGYIYNSERWISKSFLFYGTFSPSVETLYKNRYLYGQNRDPDAERSAIISTKATYRYGNHETSLLAARYIKMNGLYFDGEGFLNFRDDITIDCYMLEHLIRLSSPGSIKAEFWTNRHRPHNSIPARNTYGASLNYIDSVGRLDIYTGLNYIYSPEVKPGFDLNAALTYRRSRNLSLFLKGSNILGKALKSEYYGIDPFTGEKSEIGNVDVIDKRLWVGVEYQF